MAAVVDVRDLLEERSSLPQELINSLLQEASPWWVQEERADVLAADLALCDPPLRAGEVRVLVHGTNSPAVWRVTVVARARSSLLADVTAALEVEGFLITKVVAATCEYERGLAVLAFRVIGSLHRTQAGWDRVGKTITDAATGATVPDPAFARGRRVRVAIHPQGNGRQLLVVEATQQMGLLSALASWLAEGGCDIEALWFDAGASSTALALIRGDLDADGLTSFLAGASRACSWLGFLHTLTAEASELLGRAYTLPRLSRPSCASPMPQRRGLPQARESNLRWLPWRGGRSSASRLRHPERQQSSNPHAGRWARHRASRAA